MRKIFTLSLSTLFLAFTIMSLTTGCAHKNESKSESEFEENDMYDGPDKAVEFEIEQTRDLSTGKVPWQKLRLAMEQTEQSRRSVAGRINALPGSKEDLTETLL
jgi:hypothetical protein